MIMPGLDGHHTLIEMQKMDLDAKVIVSSGFYHEEDISDVSVSSHVVARLNKPFNLHELSMILTNTLL
jgi:DNA-binding NtrC family response regulator